MTRGIRAPQTSDLKPMQIDIGLELRKQLNFIITSCRGFDDGRMEEALRIAVAARVLFHNTPQSKALFGGHCDATGIRMISTTEYSSSDPVDKRHQLGFIWMHPSIGSFKAALDEGRRKEEVALNHWWAEEAIMALFHQPHQTVTRRQLVLASANKDGGAHIDETKPADYKRLQDGLSMEVVCGFKDGITRKVKLLHANLVALRQIGHEILSSPSLQRVAMASMKDQKQRTE